MSSRAAVAEMPDYAHVAQEEVLTSQEVCRAVLEEAMPLNVLDMAESAGSERRQLFYNLVERTPLVRSHYDLKGHRGLMKDETIQPSAAYKIRGALNAVMRAVEADPDVESVHIASAGNAGNAAAIAGNVFGLGTYVHGARGMSSAKVARLQRNGAHVLDFYDTLEDAMQGATDQGRGEHAATIHAFDQVEVIAGQATVGFELVADLLAAQRRGSVDVLRDSVKLFVPVGGGGLITGVATAVRWAKERGLLGDANVQVIGVQLEGCDAMRRAIHKLRSGQAPERLFRPGEFNKSSDGTAVLEPGRLTRSVVADKDFVQDIVVVDEAQLGAAMRRSATMQQRVEPAGALARAGAEAYARAYPAGPRGIGAETIVTLTTGSNVSDELHRHFMQADAAATERQWQRELAEQHAYRERMYALGATGLKEAVGRPGPKPARGAFLSGTFLRS